MTFTKRLCIGATWALVGLGAGFSLQSHAQGYDTFDDFHDKLVQLGSGPAGGSFGPLADTLCETLNDVRKKTLVRCVPQRSAGSVFNIHAVANGSLQLGLAQEDLLVDHIRRGDGVDKDSLRAVAPMHNSFVAVMVRRASGITELSQIGRGVINKGIRGSGTFAQVTAVLKALSLEDRDLAGFVYLNNNDLERDFCDGKVDVFLSVQAHPSDLYRRTRECGGEFLDMPLQIMQKLMAQNVWIRQMEIPSGTYDPEQKSVMTIGMRNLLIAHTNVDETTISRVTRVLLESHKSMQAKQAFLASSRMLRREETNSLAIPLHPGALKAINSYIP